MAVRINALQEVSSQVDRASRTAYPNDTGPKQPPRAAEEPAEGPSPQPEMLTPDEAARLLRVNRKTIYAAIRDKKLPGVLQLGPRAVRIRRSALLGSGLGQPVGSLNRSGV